MFTDARDDGQRYVGEILLSDVEDHIQAIQEDTKERITHAILSQQCLMQAQSHGRTLSVRRQVLVYFLFVHILWLSILEQQSKGEQETSRKF